jgi:hypothetical protein
MNGCTECRTPVRPGRACPSCGGTARAARTAAAALLGLVASPLFACQEMYGITVVDTGPPTPELRVTPTSLDLGEVAVGAEAEATVELQNIGESLLALQALAIDPAPAPFSAEASVLLPVELEPGETVDGTVTFAPTAPGAATATLRITSDDANEPEVVVAVEGVGTP